MRVSNSMKTNSSLKNISNNLNRWVSASDKAYSGKRVQKPSDDPSSISSIISSRRNIQFNSQYKKNIEESKGFLDTADSSLRNLNDLLQRTKELTVQGANEVLSQDAFDSIADEISQIKEQVATIANSKYNDKYLFGGISSRIPPCGGTPPNWNLPPEAMKDMLIEVDSETFISVNTSGSDIFNGTGSSRNLFDMLSDIENNLRSGDTASLRGRMDEVDSAMSQVLTTLSSVGSRGKQAEILSSKIDDSDILMKELLSQKEDADVAEALIELNEAEVAYKTSLSLSNKIMSLNILDYLR